MARRAPQRFERGTIAKIPEDADGVYTKPYRGEFVVIDSERVDCDGDVWFRTKNGDRLFAQPTEMMLTAVVLNTAEIHNFHRS